MSGPAFFETRIGQRFLEATVPEIAAQLQRLNLNLERRAGSRSGTDAPATTATARVEQRNDVGAILAQIAHQHLGIATLQPRHIVGADAYELHVGSLEAALQAAYDAGVTAGRVDAAP